MSMFNIKINNTENDLQPNIYTIDKNVIAVSVSYLALDYMYFSFFLVYVL